MSKVRVKIRNNLEEEGKFSITISENCLPEKTPYHIWGLDKSTKNLLESMLDLLGVDYETRYLIKKKIN